MYRGGPNVEWYALKVRHAKRGVRVRVRPILANFGKILAKNPCFLGIGELGPLTKVGMFFTSKWHIVGAL